MLTSEIWILIYDANIRTLTKSEKCFPTIVCKLFKINMPCFLVLQCTLQQKFLLCIPFLGIARPQSQFPLICVCERFIYSHISCSRIGRSMVGIYKSLTDTWMWELGLWPCYSFSGNICFQFSVLFLCSALPGVDRMASTPGAAPTFTQKTNLQM